MAGVVCYFFVVAYLDLLWSVLLDRRFVTASTTSIPSNSSIHISVVLPPAFDSSCNELSAHRFKDRGRAASRSTVDPSFPSDVSAEDRRGDYGTD